MGTAGKVCSLIFYTSFTKSFRHCVHFSGQQQLFVIASVGLMTEAITLKRTPELWENKMR